MKTIALFFSILLAASTHANACLNLAGGKKVCVGNDVSGGFAEGRGDLAFGEGATVTGFNRNENQLFVRLRPGVSKDGANEFKVNVETAILPMGCVQNNTACVNDNVIQGRSTAWSEEYQAYEVFWPTTRIIGVNSRTNKVVVSGHFVGGTHARIFDAHEIFVARGCLKGVCPGDIVAGASIDRVVKGINKRTGEVAVMDTRFANGDVDTIKAEKVFLKKEAEGMDEEREASQRAR